MRLREVMPSHKSRCRVRNAGFGAAVRVAICVGALVIFIFPAFFIRFVPPTRPF